MVFSFFSLLTFKNVIKLIVYDIKKYQLYNYYVLILFLIIYKNKLIKNLEKNIKFASEKQHNIEK